MADVDGSGTRAGSAVDHDETPAIICGSCRGETPLASLRPAFDPPRCRHCGTLFPGFRSGESFEVDHRPTVRALVAALDAGEVHAAAALVCADVIWQEAPDGPSAAGRDAVVELWRQSAEVSRSVGELEMHEDVVAGLVLERDRVGGADRLVRWYVGFDGELIRSCWVWDARGESGPGRPTE